MKIKQLLFLTLTTISLNSLAGSVVVVSKDSPISSVNKETVVKVFLGKTKEINGAKVVLIDQDASSETRTNFYKNVVNKSQAQLKSYWSRLLFTGKGQPPQTVGNSSDVKALLSTNPNVVGYLDKSEVDSSVKVIYEE